MGSFLLVDDDRGSHEINIRNHRPGHFASPGDGESLAERQDKVLEVQLHSVDRGRSQCAAMRFQVAVAEKRSI